MNREKRQQGRTFSNEELTYHEKLILVSGFSGNTRDSDIEQMFSSFGFERIHWIDKRYCVVCVRNFEEAMRSKKISDWKVELFQNSKKYNMLKHTHFFDKMWKQRNEKPKKPMDLTIDEDTRKRWEEMIEQGNKFGECNPPIQICTLEWEGKKLHVVRDDFLVGGTKQRALIPIVHGHKATMFVYAGPVYGYAQVALAYAAKVCGKKAAVFVEERELHPLTRQAQNLGAEVHQVPNGYLARVQEAAEKFVKEMQEKDGQEYVELLPFGLLTKEFVWLLKRQIEKALPLVPPPSRLWIVVGSGTIVTALSNLWPDTHLLLVQVGKWVEEKRLKGSYEIFIAPEEFAQPAKISPPYPSVANYDAKLWQFAQKHAKDGDFVWNVGKDVE